jgi:hypothetical protein
VNFGERITGIGVAVKKICLKEFLGANCNFGKVSGAYL